MLHLLSADPAKRPIVHVPTARLQEFVTAWFRFYLGRKYEAPKTAWDALLLKLPYPKRFARMDTRAIYPSQENLKLLTTDAIERMRLPFNGHWVSMKRDDRNAILSTSCEEVGNGELPEAKG